MYLDKHDPKGIIGFFAIILGIASLLLLSGSFDLPAGTKLRSWRIEATLEGKSDLLLYALLCAVASATLVLILKMKSLWK